MNTNLLSSHLASMVASTLQVHAENWSQFRGPSAQGISADKKPPLTWSATENIALKTELPGESWSSPVIWGDRFLVTTATDAGESCHILPLDGQSGKIIWDKEVFKRVQRRKQAREMETRSRQKRKAPGPA